MITTPSLTGNRRLLGRRSNIRDSIYATALERLQEWVAEIGSTRGEFAKRIGIPLSTLGNITGRRHKRSPHKATLDKLLKCNGLPDDLREMLLDVRDYDARVLPRLLRGER